MKVSQLIHAMDRDDAIVIDDYEKTVEKITIYDGTVRGIKRDNPINKMHIESIFASDDTIYVLATNPKEYRRRAVEEVTT